jgi:UDP-N-acetylmuramoyl-L-alanyl-D-glutamate--2,6-diaminopimelate ligase
MNLTLTRPSQAILNIENQLRSRVQNSAHLCADTRLLKVGDVFVAYPVGSGDVIVDNRAHIPAALDAGAGVVLYEDAAWDESSLPQARQSLVDERCIAVRGLAEMVGELASAWYGYPSQQLKIIGITGTNGKTTVSHWVAQALASLSGVNTAAVIGTLGVGHLGYLDQTGFTTPDAPRLHRILADFVSKHIQSVAMEVSSHALDQGRVSGVVFKTAIFTNLTQDHLDYHGDMVSYAAAKRRLFDWPKLQHAVIHLDDPIGQNWLVDLQKNEALSIWAYGSKSVFEKLSKALQEDLRKNHTTVLIDQITSTPEGMSFECEIQGVSHFVKLNCIGEFNVKNAAAVLCVLLAEGVDVKKALTLIEQLKPVPGRMEMVNQGDFEHPLMVVDFAHTPDALQKSLEALRGIANARGGKLVCIFGCGGNRDAKKRPEMGAIATQFADEVVITSDNPRFENPDVIMDQISSGISSSCMKKVVKYADRATAILTSVRQSTKQDVLLVAGKGHESTQEIAGKKIPFSDVDHIRLAIRGSV